MTCCGLLHQCHVSDCNALLQHAVLEVCCSRFSLKLFSPGTVDAVAVASGIACFWPSYLLNTVSDLMERGVSEAHEWFCFIWCCCTCSIIVVACLPVFILSAHQLRLYPSLSACLPYSPTMHLPAVYCCCVTAQMSKSRWMLQSSVTLATAASSATQDTKHCNPWLKVFSSPTVQQLSYHLFLCYHFCRSWSEN